ncbi:hypothetical protein [Williamsia sp. D3]|uniref:hypothetical protein n=1 Tax=Williamsia sp. D3 TaxID=1313067 RepID=UPI00041F526B|nr:hypothetical protein [Williamsia sp. D3]
MYVSRITFAALIFDIVSDCVEFAAERVDVDLGEVGVSSDVGDGHGVHSAPASLVREVSSVVFGRRRTPVLEVDIVQHLNIRAAN